MSSKLCMCCMQQVPDEAMSCPHCGYDGTYENESCALPLGSRVNGRYALGKTIDSDGETITYIGFDIPARKRVAIKEYMPASGAVRSGEAVEARQGAEIHYKNGLSDFSELYGSLKLLSYETGMIAVQDFFTANDTAYAVLEQFDGITLREFMDIKKEPLTFDQAMRLFDPVFDALRAIHGAKLIHRGVSPETIYIRKDGAVKLGGYATAAIRTKGSEFKARLYDGYTAPEQYVANAFLSPSADVYALASCLYMTLSATVPPDAQQRKLLDTLQSLQDLQPDVKPQISKALNQALLLNPKERTQTVDELRQSLYNERPAEYHEQQAEVKSQPEAVPAVKISKAELKKLELWRKLAIISGCVCGALLLLFTGWQIFRTDGGAGIVNPTDDTEQKEVVPDLTGQDIYLDVVSYDKDYRYELNFVYNDTVEENKIVNTSPAANTELGAGSKVTVNVSKGSYMLKMPSFIGYTAKNATLALDELKLNYSFVTQTDNSKINGTIFKQSVEAGTEFNAGSTEVIFYIAASNGSEISNEGGEDQG